jgi:HEAT repeat protein
MSPVVLLFFALSIATEQSALSEHDDAFDLALLKEHGIKTDAAWLLGFFRDRTLDDGKIKHIHELIRQLGNPRFQVRDKANKELLAIGMPALHFLEEATRDPDSEIVERAQRLIERIKSGPGPSLPIAALRQLRKLKPPDAVAVLIAYVPFAEDVSVEDEALAVLAKIALVDGKPHTTVREAAGERSAARRGAAGYVLARSTADADRAIARRLLGDDDPWVQFRAAEGFFSGRNNEAIPALINLLTAGKEEVAWRAEELLQRVAGENSPSAPTDGKPGARREYQSAWSAWYEKHKNEIDFAKLSGEAPVLGLWVGIEYNTSSVWECGRDGKRRWTISARGPMDAQVLPNNRILVAEQTAKCVTERDLKGNILWEFNTDEETLNCRRLPNGNTFIGTRLSVMEVRPDKSVVFRYKVTDNYMHAVRRLPNGGFVGITSGGAIHELAPNGKPVRTVTLTHEGTWGDVDALPGGRYLVANYGIGFVREVDAAGKTLREAKIADACGLDRLPNGQLLVSGQGKAMIVDWAGKYYWETKSDGSIRRAHRR